MSINYDPSTNLPVLIKQPGESILFDVDMAPIMRTGDAITYYVSGFPAFINMGKVLGSGNITISGLTSAGAVAQFRVAGGTDKEHYKISLRVATVGGDTIEADVMLYVVD